MKDEVEKLLKLIYGPDVVEDAYASPAGKITKKNARTTLLALIDKAQVEAVRVAAQEIHDSGMGGAKDDSERFWRMVKTATDIVDEAEANLKEDGETK